MLLAPASFWRNVKRADVHKISVVSAGETILKLIDAEISNGSKDYDQNYIRKHVEKLTS